ncbi:hypothetical protein K438DRAFT_1783156 [Mycena galopus ATCC 62051]|nr:hypothetical protein K438DRAFT_1783156 [Mycena galopus ATCC 62051]
MTPKWRRRGASGWALLRQDRRRWCGRAESCWRGASTNGLAFGVERADAAAAAADEQERRAVATMYCVSAAYDAAEHRMMLVGLFVTYLQNSLHGWCQAYADAAAAAANVQARGSGDEVLCKGGAQCSRIKRVTCLQNSLHWCQACADAAAAAVNV